MGSGKHRTLNNFPLPRVTSCAAGLEIQIVGTGQPCDRRSVFMPDRLGCVHCFVSNVLV
jgi:hypothetical protein